jgi:DNA-binding PadR family transcriptional regulator
MPTEADAWSFIPLTDLSFQVLLALTGEPLHGYAILKAIEARTDGRLKPESGTLYTAIRRLARDGLLEVDEAGAGRRGRSYRLTETGRQVVRLESERLAALVREARERRVLQPEGGSHGR